MPFVCDEIAKCVVACRADLEKLPFARVKDRFIRQLQNVLIESARYSIGFFPRGDGERHGEMNFTAVELAVMIEAHAGKCGDESGEGFKFVGAESCGGASFVVIFEEARGVALRSGCNGEARMNVVDVAVAQSVVEAFVVGELEAEGLNGSFAIPINFGEPDKFTRERGDGFGPEFASGRFAPAEKRIPGVGENVVQDKHGHVAADAVAVIRDFAEFADERGARGGFEVIELENVAPGREVRVAAVSEENGFGGCFLEKKGGRILAKIFLRASNEIFGVRRNPGVVGRGVVGDEIQNQADAASAELFSGVVEIGPRT